MKIDKSRLNPLYDQYSNVENRLTHALLHTISCSASVLANFLREIAGIRRLSKRETYEICTQKVPFSHGDLETGEIESIPDAWIVDCSSQLGIAIEVKDKKNALRLEQLQRHANRIGAYREKYLLIITPDHVEPKKARELKLKAGRSLNVAWCSWDRIYRWLESNLVAKSGKGSEESFLFSSMKDYLERRSEVLGFRGIRFPDGFNVIEAKNILNAEMEELEPTVRKKFKGLGEDRRPAITTFSQEAVWDCFAAVGSQFTRDLHFSLSIHEGWQDISLTIPNAASKAWTRLKTVVSREKEKAELRKILEQLRKRLPHLYLIFLQRHFRAMRFGTIDGILEFSMDTLGGPFRNPKAKAKVLPVWWDAFQKAILRKTSLNAEVQFNARFFFNETKEITRPQFLRTAETTLLNFKPLYDFMRKT